MKVWTSDDWPAERPIRLDYVKRHYKIQDRRRLSSYYCTCPLYFKMPTLVDTLKFILLFLCGAGFYATWYLLLNNGTTEHLAHIRDVGPRLLPGTKESIKTSYTGIAAIDYQLTVLDLFFWEMVDGSRPEASLFCYHFAGQVFSGWGLLLLESLRSGNSWRAISL